jgi:hypothetical protein
MLFFSTPLQQWLTYRRENGALTRRLAERM